MPVYGALDEKLAIEGILKAQQNQEGDIDTVTVYLFLAKITCLNLKLPNNGIPLIYRQFTVHPPVYGTLNNKTKRGIPIYLGPFTVTVYRFMAKKRCRFRFVLVLEDVCSFQ